MEAALKGFPLNRCSFPKKQKTVTFKEQLFFWINIRGFLKQKIEYVEPNKTTFFSLIEDKLKIKVEDKLTGNKDGKQ